jgi:hypothetical protein
MPSLKSVAKKVSGAAKSGSLSGAFSSGLVKLKIKSCDDADATKEKKDGASKLEFIVQLNPNKLDEKVTVEYSDTSAAGKTDGVKKFKEIKSSDITLEFTLDGTGVAPGANEKPVDDSFVDEQIKLLRKVTCAYDGDKHEPPYVNIIWGSFDYKARLSSLDISHVLFTSQGKPLRSNIKATFSSVTSPKTQAKEQSKSSPDLTHVRTVRTGDTLPLMCQTIYNDSSYYLKVAKFNNLVDFRNLDPGSEIIFPPVI